MAKLIDDNKIGFMSDSKDDINNLKNIISNVLNINKNNIKKFKCRFFGGMYYKYIDDDIFLLIYRNYNKKMKFYFENNKYKTILHLELKTSKNLEKIIELYNN